MSAADVEIVQAFYRGAPMDLVPVFHDDARRARLVAAIEPLVHHDFEFVFDAGGAPLALGLEPSYRGAEGFARAMRDWTAMWRSFETAPGQFVDAGDCVLVLSHERGVTRDGGEVQNAVATVFWVNDGKIARMSAFQDRALALKAAGLA